MTEGRRSIWHLIAAAVVIVLVSIFVAGIIPDKAVSVSTKTYQFGLPPLPEKLAAFPKVIGTTESANIRSLAAILVDADSGMIVYEKNAEQVVPIASTTKLMTAQIARKKLNLDQVVDITNEHTSVIGSDMGLRPGEKITARNLLIGLLVASGNDASWALAEASSGSREAFVTEMNAQAVAMGLENTHFADPAGLETESKSTAHELATIARLALRDSILAEMVRIPEITITSTNGSVRHDLKNSNRLVNEYAYPGAIGLKTGFTPDAGHCLVAGAERDGHQLIAVILHTDADTITASAIEARKLLDWGWTNIRWTETIK